MAFDEFLSKAYEYIPPGTYWAILNEKGELLTSDLSQGAERLAVKITQAGMTFWDVGDYQVKSLGGGRKLFIFKITSAWALALESSEREGVLLHLARQLKNLVPAEAFAGAPVPTEEKKREEEVEGISPSIPAYAEISYEMIPVIVPQPGKAIELRPEILALLKVIDGEKNLLTLASEIGVEPQKLRKMVSELTSQGLLQLKVPPRIEGPVYELAPTFKSPEEALLLAGPSMKVRTIVLNLYRPLSIPQIVQILREAGLETDTDDVASIMKNLEARGIVRKRR